MTKGVIPQETIAKTIDVAKAVQIASFVRENQILTAVCLFVLWQTGAFLSAYGQVQGAMC
jgi:hypothetical protein